MRIVPSKDNTTLTPRFSNMTLYEMADSMCEEGEDIQDALPYLVKWMFNEFWKNYRYNNIPYSTEYAYNIAYFTFYNFLNREICSKKPDAFRTKLLKEVVNMNLDADFYNVLNDLKSASIELRLNIQTDDDLTASHDDTRTDNLRTDVDKTDAFSGLDTTTHNTEDTSDVSSTSDAKNTSTSKTDIDNTATQTLNTTNTTNTENSTDVTNSSTENITDNSTDTSTQRSVATDYPQSTVNTSTVGSWDYASGANDINKNETHTDNNTTTNNSTSNTDVEGQTTTTNTGTVTNVTDGTTENNSSSEAESNLTSNTVVKRTGTDSTQTTSTDTVDSVTTQSGTVNNAGTKNSERDLETTQIWDGMSSFDKDKLLTDVFNKHNSFYKKLMTRFENCFISVYVDDDRDGWIDPTVDLMAQWEV